MDKVYFKLKLQEVLSALLMKITFISCKESMSATEGIQEAAEGFRADAPISNLGRLDELLEDDAHKYTLCTTSTIGVLGVHESN